MRVSGRTAIGIPAIPSPAPNHKKKTVVFMDNRKTAKTPQFQKLQKEVSRLRS